MIWGGAAGAAVDVAEQPLQRAGRITAQPRGYVHDPPGCSMAAPVSGAAMLQASARPYPLVSRTANYRHHHAHVRVLSKITLRSRDR
jgi:hypothetical protein